eukprot:scaffold1850_cov194-Pinguiococcus_pyrenoidosus.AAC.56
MRNCVDQQIPWRHVPAFLKLGLPHHVTACWTRKFHIPNSVRSPIRKFKRYATTSHKLDTNICPVRGGNGEVRRCAEASSS